PEKAISQPQEQRQAQVELLLDSERPGVQQRLRLRRRAKVAGLPPEIKVRGGKQRRQQRFRKLHQLRGKEKDPGEHGSSQQENQQCRKNPPNPVLVKSSQREFSRRQ